MNEDKKVYTPAPQALLVGGDAAGGLSTICGNCQTPPPAETVAADEKP